MLLQLCEGFCGFNPRKKGIGLHTELCFQANGSDGPNTARISGSED